MVVETATQTSCLKISIWFTTVYADVMEMFRHHPEVTCGCHIQHDCIRK